MKPILLVMAAGMGSRFGGPKQITPLGPNGEIIINYSLYDAHKAGFDKAIFVIKEDMRSDFDAVLSGRIPQGMSVEYAYQKIDDLPCGYTVPKGRVKPWGTAHAIAAARNLIDTPFAVINADDYYGANAFSELYSFLCQESTDSVRHFAMVAYQLKNTLTENGSVSRGVCVKDENDMLLSVTEHTHIEKDGENAKSTFDGESWIALDGNTPVSMNLWGFTPEFIKTAWNGFDEFLCKNLTANPLKCEYYLPSVAQAMIDSGKADVKVLTSADRWYGVTHKADADGVKNALKALHECGVYPKTLW